MKASIQICGTGSDVGKSVIVTALCRIFLQDGFQVCPFKAQNMSLNSFVTKQGLEMGRAQVTQAQSSRIEPDADMNPVLIKPTSNVGSQIIVQGEPIGNMTAREYQNKENKMKLFTSVKESLARLKKKYEVIVIEGAGSPAEINLKAHDIVNMKIAHLTDSPVILVGDIDKGGVFASLVGTMELLNAKDKKRIKGFIINKFRGDKELLKGGIDFLERKTKRPVLGVIPYFKDIRLPQEDSVALEKMGTAPILSTSSSILKNGRCPHLNIAAIKLPHISNFTDFNALENEPDVNLSYATEKEALKNQDVIIIPGTKNTIQDLLWMKSKAIAQEITQALKSKNNAPVLIGICGGYQMLGRRILDPYGIESRQKEIQGLGILPMVTTLGAKKTLSQVEAIEIKTKLMVTGYEIHHGKTIGLSRYTPMFKIKERLDGATLDNGRAWGTYLHGVFDNNIFRRSFLNNIRCSIGFESLPIQKDTYNLENEFDKLASMVRENVDMKMIYEVMEVSTLSPLPRRGRG